MSLFSCKHPFKYLVVADEQTVAVADEDFEHVDYHLLCGKCGEQLALKHARCIGGVEAFLERGRK